MKAAIYNPYLDTLGGGERYTITFAKVLSEIGYDVYIEWKEKDILEKLSKRFGLKLSKNIYVSNDIKRGEDSDLCFWVSDGSIPTLRARNNYIHFQYPFHDVNGDSLLNKMKFFRINKFICNSKFTKKVIDKEYGINSDILYPPVDIDSFKPKRKLNQIAYIGRFSVLTQNKGQDILIEQFKKLTKAKNFTDWKLVLAGGSEVGAEENIKKLKTLSKGHNIEIVESPSFDKLKNILGQSKIFWSAAGYGVDENKNPEKVEHFGITLVEAMSAGCVPVVYNAGGPKEVVEHGKNGFLWQKKGELLKLTEGIINDGHLTKTSKDAIKSSNKFGHQNFKKSSIDLLK